MISLLNLDAGHVRTYVVDACAGLIGNETLHQYPCALYKEKTFLVWLGETDISIFSKSTFMNLCSFAEETLGAAKMIFILSANHAQKKQYRSMLKVIDAERVASGGLMATFGLPDKASARQVQEQSSFYELQL